MRATATSTVLTTTTAEVEAGAQQDSLPAKDTSALHNPAQTGMPAHVVFCDAGGIPWLKLLRPGFRHCFLLLEHNTDWILYNPLSHTTEIAWLRADDGQRLLALYPRRIKLTVAHAPLVPLPWRPFTCVEAVKRVLGLRATRVFTPWQLWRHLTRRPDGCGSYFYLDIDPI